MLTYEAVKAHGISVTLDGHGADELFGGYTFDFRIRAARRGARSAGSPSECSMLTSTLNRTTPNSSRYLAAALHSGSGGKLKDSVKRASATA